MTLRKIRSKVFPKGSREGTVVEIPVERTINETYRFTFRNIISIFGIAWFPGLIAAGALAAAIWFLWPDITNLIFALPAGKEPEARAVLAFMTRAFALAGPFYLLVWVLHTMAIVGVQRKALGLIEGPVFFYFSLGSAVWRLMAAQLVVFLLLYVGFALAAIGVVAVIGVGEYFHFPAIYGLVDAAAVAGAICLCLYVFARLFFFLTPVVVAEGGIGIGRAWRLGAGNFWRIVLLVIVCMWVPAMALGMISNVVMMPLMMGVIGPMARAAQEHQVQSPAEFWAMAWPSLKYLVYFMIGFQVVTWPIMLGVTNAMSARAYKNVTPPDAVALL
jgi:hypothetical protein